MTTPALAALLLASVAVVPSHPVDKPSPLPDKPGKPVGVQLKKSEGSACNKGVAVAVSPDKSAVTVTYSNYVVTVPATGKGAGKQKDCTLSMTLDAGHDADGTPYSVALTTVVFRGYARLSDRAKARLSAQASMVGGGATGKKTWPLEGAYDDAFTFTHEFPGGKTLWSPCGQPAQLDISGDMSVTRGGPSDEVSSITLDSGDAEATRVGVEWKRC